MIGVDQAVLQLLHDASTKEMRDEKLPTRGADVRTLHIILAPVELSCIDITAATLA
jgi:hypothetical protein